MPSTANDSSSFTDEVRIKSRNPAGGGSSFVPLAGVQLILLDSQSGGTGGLHPPAYYMAVAANNASRLSSYWARALLSTTASTGTGLSVGASTNMVSVAGAGSVGTLEQYCPSKLGIWIKPAVPVTDVMAHSALEFPMNSADGWFIQLATPCSFTVQFDSGTVFPITIPAGVVGTPYKAFTVTNPAGNAIGSVKMTAFVGQTVYVGMVARTNVPETALTLGIRNFALAGQTTAQYLSGVRNAAWMTALGCTGAIINTGTNDVGGTVASDRAAFKTNLPALLNECNTGGVTDANILLCRPNQNSMNLLGIMETVAAARPTLKFTSIIRLYGPLSVFTANGWMSDSVHTNDIFNAIWGNAEYHVGQLPNAFAAINNGTNQRYYTQLATNTMVLLNSFPTFTGDFTARISGSWPATRAMYLFCTSDNFNEDMVIQANGSVRFSIHEEHMDSTAGDIVAGRFDLEFKRVGLVGTITNKLTNTILKTASFSFLDTAVYGKIGASIGASSNAGVIDGVTVNGYQWILNQDLDSETVVATSGGIDGAWLNRQVDDAYVSKYGLIGGTLTNTFDGYRTI